MVSNVQSATKDPDIANDSVRGIKDNDSYVIIDSSEAKGVDENGDVGQHKDNEKGDEEEEEDGNEEESNLMKAPDGGYGWVVVFASFLHHVLVGGFARSEGLFFLQYQERFHSSAQLTAWPSSLMSTVNFFMGPLCGAFVNRYSVRTALILAILLSSTSYILNGFAPNVYFLFFSSALLGGLGRGLMCAVLLINLYFDKHRSVANGLSMSGVGFGSFAIVPLVTILFEVYGFTGAYLIIGAIELNGIVTAMLLRPLSMHLRFLRADKLRKERLANKEECVKLTATPKNRSSNSDSRQRKFTPQNSVDRSTDQKTDNKTELVIEDTIEPGKVSRSSVDISASLPDLRRPRKKQNCLQSSLAIIFPVEYQRKGDAKKPEAFHWHLLKNVPFLIFCLSNMFFLIAFKTAFTFLPAMAISKGLSKREAALVLTVSGALDTFGRMAFGFVMDIKVCRPLRPYVFTSLLFFISGASLLVPSLNSLATYCVVSSAYGFMTGAFISQKMVVLIDILGREVMPSSLGISKVFQGIGSLIGPPFAGALRDSLGSFDSAFYMGGACMFGSGLLMVLSNILMWIQKRRQSKVEKEVVIQVSNQESGEKIV
ncbi:monocarboxylate transporter 12-B-like [Physella acuta]|uniref:monocarboxylate transporter 12-B-like n=1 Tax=Physella acuta TaxID=109671 RepID=UPI0027DBD858|nr:monocarboxylate transporter 12-B-like [Physella acuta]